jgi:hypothetical protein
MQTNLQTALANMHYHSNHAIGLALACLLMPTPSSAQDASQQINQMVGAMCPQFTKQLAIRPELVPMNRARPVNLEAVCSCTEKTFSSDSRLQSELNLGGESLRERMKSEHLRSYFTMRLIHSVLICLAPEFEATLSATSPSE